MDLALNEVRHESGKAKSAPFSAPLGFSGDLFGKLEGQAGHCSSS
jgi:hypothetical protein